MEIAVKIAVYLTLGVALVACNVWYIRAVYQGMTGGGLVVSPVKAVGGTGDAAIAGETLARLIISKLQSLEWDLRQSQSALKDAAKRTNPETASPPATPAGITAGILDTPKMAVLNAQLFEATDINVKVAGVDVGGLVPRIQRWFVADRTLAFSVSWEGKTATVAGNIDALGIGTSRPVWMSIENATASSIAEAIALALIHRQWARDSVEFGELEDNEFNKLVIAINEVAKINRQVITYNSSRKSDFEKVLPTVDPLVDRITGWGGLTNFVASIAEAAGKYDRALALYRQMRNAPTSPLAADVLTAKIATLEGLTKTAAGNIQQVGLQKMEKSVADATRILNRLFGLSLSDPQVELISDEIRNAYWDGNKINVPLAVQDMPDIVYHEVAWPFISDKWQPQYQGQAGALAQSYTDVLTSLVKQTVLNQNAKNADWTIAPGAVAWVTGKPNEIATDKRPLRSLKEPGKAYDDPTLGKDPQVDHYSKLIKASNTAASDFGGVHTNSGIPNRAFYETAMQIGSEKAGEIWIKSLGQFTESIDLRTASQVVYKTAVDLYGEESAEAKGVKAGWSAVGL
jgi:hypothetical protein